MRPTGKIEEVKGPLLLIGDEDPWSRKVRKELADDPLGRTAVQLVKDPDMPAPETEFWEWAHKEYADLEMIAGRWPKNKWIQDRIDSLRPIVKSIMENGYQKHYHPNYEVWEHDDGTLYPVGPITIWIGPHGNFLLEKVDGFRRMCVLVALGLPIVAMVAGRDQRWEKLRADLRLDRQGRKYLYSYIAHPDFADWEVAYADTEKYDCIVDEIAKVGPGSLLDVGTHFGYMPFRLAEAGLLKGEVLAVENYGIWAAVADSVLMQYGYNATLSDIYPTMLRVEGQKFNNGVMLAIVYHLLRVKGDKLAKEIIQRVGAACDRIFFDDFVAGRENVGSSRIRNIVKVLPKWAGHGKARRIGTDNFANRGIWVCEKKD